MPAKAKIDPNVRRYFEKIVGEIKLFRDVNTRFTSVDVRTGQINKRNKPIRGTWLHQSVVARSKKALAADYAKAIADGLADGYVEVFEKIIPMRREW